MTEFFRNLIFTDFWLKLFSLALAVLTWFTISSAIRQETSPRTTLALTPLVLRSFPNLPVVVLSSAENVRSCRVEPQMVEVSVEGDAKTVRNLEARDIRVVLDLTGIEAAHDLKKRVEVFPPAGVTLVKVDPEQVQVIYPPRN